MGILFHGCFWITSLFFQTIKLVTNLNDVEVVTGIAFILCSVLLTLLKVFYLVWNNKTIKQLKVALKSDMFQPRTQQ